MPAFQTPFGHVNWRISERCDGGACVMVGSQAGSIFVGNTKKPDGPYVIYTNSAWEKFLLSAKRGDFDRPAG